MATFTVISLTVLEYGVSILPEECVKKLQKLQNKCIMLVDLNKTPLENKYKINKILRIKEIILLESCKLGYKIVNN